MSPTTSLITLAHGSGARATHELVTSLFLRHFNNPILATLEDGACLPTACENSAAELIVATDGHVVSPLFFPGGDIGTLAINGTLNDVAMAGGRCRYLTASFILEEGFPVSQLEKIVISMAETARAAGVQIIAGDTKVVERGKCDGVFISTTGIGQGKALMLEGLSHLQPGDHILLSGDIGRHGATILSHRQGLKFESDLTSDCADLGPLIAQLTGIQGLRCLRDATRGGVSAVLNEWAQASGHVLQIDEARIPVSPNVAALCDLLGLDPLYLACEGRCLLICTAESAESVLTALQAHPLGVQACRVGVVVESDVPRVELLTIFGGRRLLDWSYGDPLPRIC
ncbi:MAG: hydrogenase expression/formation protein HypE [Hahellaceae bacterium]|jgi:hydrogenase expression/formation protein HypE|nr:hydrogenase expression/formation protein HypE [Hahellaceae bacterium]